MYEEPVPQPHAARATGRAKAGAKRRARMAASFLTGAFSVKLAAILPLSRCVVFAFFVVLSVICTERRVGAHTLGLSSGEYRAEGSKVFVRASFAVADGLRLTARLDGDGDGRVSASEVLAARESLAKALEEGLVITGDGKRCAPTLNDAALTEGDGLLVELSFACGDEPREVEVSLPLLATLGETHRHVARTVGLATADVLLSSASPKATLRPRPASADAEVSRDPKPERPPTTRFRPLVFPLLALGMASAVYGYFKSEGRLSRRTRASGLGLALLLVLAVASRFLFS